jgi:cytoskeletal protein CcmA (bactofilin family)
MMALWRKTGTTERGHADHSLSIIGESAQVEGTLDIPGNLRIEGTFRGRAIVGHRLVVAESAQVKGTLEAREVLIAGTFEGEIKGSQHVEIASTAYLKGTIHSQKLEVHSGATLLLTCQIGDIQDTPSSPDRNGTSPKPEPLTKDATPPTLPKDKHK